MHKQLENILSEFYKVLSYGEWCSDDDGEDGYYCKEFVDSLHEILGEAIDVLANMLGYEEADPDTIFNEISSSVGIENFSDLYWEIMEMNLEMRYGRVLNYSSINGYDLGVRVENMLSTLASIEIEEESEDE
ncbi:MAG: hypothetical protein RBQ97_12115 [Acholeplasma sp.]|nr:hypothetical protein [Acholeplasma sp.]